MVFGHYHRDYFQHTNTMDREEKIADHSLVILLKSKVKMDVMADVDIVDIAYTRCYREQRFVGDISYCTRTWHISGILSI
jgi:hypothetical protein